MNDKVIEDLYQVIKIEGKSYRELYTKYLFDKGLDKILKR